jgi:hypothetical protein
MSTFRGNVPARAGPEGDEGCRCKNAESRRVNRGRFAGKEMQNYHGQFKGDKPNCASIWSKDLTPASSKPPHG